MVKKIKKDWLLWLIIGIIVLALGIVSLIMYIQKKDPAIPIGDGKMIDLVLLASGILVIILAIYFIFPETKHGRQAFRVCYWIEFVVALAVAIFGFLVPFTTMMIGGNNPLQVPGDLVFWYGLLLYFHGVIKLAECAFSSPTKKTAWFWFGIVTVTLGLYLFFNGSIYLEYLKMSIVAFLIVIGLVLTVLSIMGYSEKSKKSKK